MPLTVGTLPDPVRSFNFRPMSDAILKDPQEKHPTLPSEALNLRARQWYFLHWINLPLESMQTSVEKPKPAQADDLMRTQPCYAPVSPAWALDARSSARTTRKPGNGRLTDANFARRRYALDAGIRIQMMAASTYRREPRLTKERWCTN